MCGIGTILLVEFYKPLYSLLLGLTILFSFYCGRALQKWYDTFNEEVFGDKNNEE